MRKIFTFLTILSACISTAFAQNVGIGTPTPVAKLEVNATDSNAATITNAQPATFTKKTRLYFRNGVYYTGAIGTEVTTETGGAPFAKLGFFTYGSNNATGLIERMTISDGGLVGINNIDPQATLDVAGTFKLQNGSQGAGKVLTSDAAGNAVWQTPTFSLPYAGSTPGTSTNAFSVISTGTAGTAAAIYGATNSTVAGNGIAGSAGVTGEVLSTGGFSAGVRGINKSTNGSGTGIMGYHAGTGYGVFGASSGIGVGGTSVSGIAGYFSSSSGTALQTVGDLKLTGIGEGAGRVLTSDVSGNATWQTPGSGAGTAFSAYLTSNLAISNNTILTGFTKYFDDGNNFNAATGTYTVPVAGTYLFKSSVSFLTAGASGNIAYLSRIRISYSGGTSRNEQVTIVQPTVSGYGPTAECSAIVKCNAGDVINMEAGHSFGSSLTLSGGAASGNTLFSGARIY